MTPNTTYEAVSNVSRIGGEGPLISLGTSGASITITNGRPKSSVVRTDGDSSADCLSGSDAGLLAVTATGLFSATEGGGIVGLATAGVRGAGVGGGTLSDEHPTNNTIATVAEAKPLLIS